jgi:hypothetical protein
MTSSRSWILIIPVSSRPNFCEFSDVKRETDEVSRRATGHEPEIVVFTALELVKRSEANVID